LNDTREHLGQTDIYLLDQFMRGRIAAGMIVLDAGCGDGRNARFLLQEGLDVRAVDADARAIDHVRSMAGKLAPQLPVSNFQVEAIEAMSLPDAAVDAVVASAVLHFARDDNQFLAMVRECWRVLRPGGLFFSRLASSIGIESSVRSLRGRWAALPDGSERYVVDAPQLLQLTASLGGELLDPLKTTIVHGQRAMTTWVVRKR
jgi:tellurite methyltransferase